MIKLIVLALFISSAVAVSVEETKELLEADKKWYSGIVMFPDGDGNMHQINFEVPLDFESLYEIERDEGIVEYYLYTRKNPDMPQTLTKNDAESIRNSNFDPSKETVFIVHGWLNSAKTEPNQTLRPAFLAKSDVNVIVVDWKRVSFLDYISSALEVPTAGLRLGQFINYLVNDFQLSYDNIHLVGYSLGAHVVGSAGRETGGKIARITALDPAGPFWNSNKSKLTDSDAVYVEAILTDGILSMISDCADVEFYVNGGILQPGCWYPYCNHKRSWQVFASSITNNHLIGRRCSNSVLRQLNMCRGEKLAMGNSFLRKDAKPGKYRVNTGESYPY